MKERGSECGEREREHEIMRRGGQKKRKSNKEKESKQENEKEEYRMLMGIVVFL